MLCHHRHSGRACPPLAESGLVPAMEVQQDARLVRRERRRARVARLFEVVDPGGAQRREQIRHCHTVLYDRVEGSGSISAGGDR
jgi:hypothetical protein